MSRYWCRAWCQASRGSRMDLAPHSRPSSNVKCDRVNWIRMRFIFRQTTSLRRCCRCRCLRLWMKVVARKQIVKIVKSCSVNVSCGPRSKRQLRVRRWISGAHSRRSKTLPSSKSARMIDCALDGGGRSSLAVAGTATYLPHYLAFWTLEYV